MSAAQAIQDKLRKRAAELLSAGEVAEVIAWGSGRFSNQTTPLFVTSADKAEGIVFNEYCTNALGKYAFWRRDTGKVALCVRGCESRAINRMLADRQLKRSDFYLLGIPCMGMKDRFTNELLDKCENCTQRNPVIYDELMADELAPEVSNAEEIESRRFERVKALEALSQEEKLTFFDKAYNRCIRCYACREVCPVCTCRSCFVDQQRANWQGKQNNLAENRFYNLTRVFHIGDRCIDCGECAFACPMDLPLTELNRKMIKDLKELFDAGDAGFTDELENALGRYDVNDLEEFM